MSHLREGLSELASEPLQRRLWLASEGPTVGSFDEAVARTYDDSGISDIVARPTPGAALEPQLADMFHRLTDALRAVDRNLAVEDLIESPAMARVRSLAAATLRALDARESETP